MYFFKINKENKLELYGVRITKFVQNEYIEIHTSDIPSHWEIMELGEAFSPWEEPWDRCPNDDELRCACINRWIFR